MKIIYNSKEIKPETMSQREYNNIKCPVCGYVNYVGI